MENIADIIQETRKKFGWNQAEFARRLNVGQQTVSGWERGSSRPRRSDIAKLARVLGMDKDKLLAVAGHSSSKARSQVDTLSLSDLAPDRFEQFIADLAHFLHPDTKVSRFGTQGHKQDGVDVIAVKDGKIVYAYQCKRRKQFGPEEVKKAVEAVPEDFSENNFIALTRLASPDTRKKMLGYKKWVLWDVEDISRVIRNDLQLGDAVKLVDRYFPGMREPFLGVSEPGPWQTPEDYYEQFEGNIYSHDWKMVGRQKILTDVTTFANGQDNWLAAIVGRGGIGKTRLLRGVSESIEAPSFSVRILTMNKPVKPEHYELLPKDCKLLVIIDDAHERTDIAEIVSGIKRVSPAAKVLLSLRPYGLTQLANDLRRVQLHTSEFPRWEVEDLKHDDAMKLVKSILGDSYNPAIISRLAQISVDCPLIAVVGAGLLNREQLNPASIEKDEGIRTEILQKFRDALVADPLGGSTETRKKVLDAISILQPVYIKDDAFQTALSNLTGVDFDDLLPHINSLEDAGVLLKRGRSIRIVPDLLGDAILTDACFDSKTGISKNYIERARKVLTGKPLQCVFINASRVDWQIRQDTGETTSLVKSLWDGVDEEFKQGGIRARCGLLEPIKKVAYFQPDRALSLVQWAIDNPTDDLEETDDLLGKIYAPSYNDVLNLLPPVLKSIAYNFDNLADALDILWQLAQTDKRQTNPYPDHPLRVLRDLAEYESGKPVEFNQAVLDVCKKWLNTSVSHELHSTFDVLERLLATEGADSFSEGLQLSIRPYAIRLEAVKDLRKQVIDLALEGIKSTDLKKSVRAVKAFGESLHYPSGLYGREVKDGEQDRWTQVFVDTINRLKPVAADKTLDPVIGLSIRQALQWHQRFSKTATKQAAIDVVALIPDDLEHNLSVLLYDGWGRLLYEHLSDYDAAQKRQAEHFEAFSKQLVTTYTADTLVELLEKRLKVHQDALDDRGNPGPLIWNIVKEDPDVGVAVCKRVVAFPDSSLVITLPVVIGRMGEDKPDQIVQLSRDLLNTGNQQIAISTAQAFGWSRGFRDKLLYGELDLLQELAVHDSAAVRGSMVRASQTIAKTDRAVAASLLVLIKTDKSQELVQEICGTLGTHGELDWQDLSSEQQKIILSHLETCDTLADYQITDFLSHVAKIEPNTVVGLLQKRVEVDEVESETRTTIREFHPVPYRWDGPLDFRAQPQFITILRDIRDWIAEKPDTSWQRIKMGSEIFKLVAGQFDEKVLAVLDEALTTGEESKFKAVTAILHDVPKQLVWENVDFVVKILHTAEQLGGDNLRNASSALHSAMISGTRSGTPGEPFAEDIIQRDNAEKIVQSLPYASIEQKFYKSLERSALESIRWHAEDDERLIDNRDW